MLAPDGSIGAETAPSPPEFPGIKIPSVPTAVRQNRAAAAAQINVNIINIIFKIINIINILFKTGKIQCTAEQMKISN